ncbi:hypothetical protein CQW23_17532 [Capsicum baccatum]|uniref:Retrovirus-related Pol polyprotein from transposon TNT 1-94-like beta-barrel domain-containing protein n=1 Tax=Capsicum baccatum TaxID=33114 RepID=A0A2G2WE65_CAPBA|nr:hypothetical protein CQW23_17532 [Capsicum baccatum]
MTSDSQMKDTATSMGETNIVTSSRTNAPPTMAPAEKPGKFGIDFKDGSKRYWFTSPLFVCSGSLAKTLLRMQLGGESLPMVDRFLCHPLLCANKELFSSFDPAQVQEMIYMANSATAKVEGIGKVCLKITSGKVLTLNNVLYVPELCRNFIYVSLLDKNGFK